MTVEILMPALSPTMTEGSLQKWHIKIGDQIKPGDLLAEIETDKATMEIEAVDEGKVTSILVKEGTNGVQVNSIIAILNEDKNSDSNKFKDLKKNEQINKVNDKNDINKNVNLEIEIVNNNEKIFKKNTVNTTASPYAKKIAKEKNIDLSKIVGSGPNNRIIERDFKNLKECDFVLDYILEIEI